MQFEGVRRSGQAPNLTPLIDIVFLLLVFFMLTAHFVKDEGMAIELPNASSAVAIDQKELVTVSLSKQGEILLGGIVTLPEMLPNQLADALAKASDKRVVIRGDAGVSLGDSVRVIDAARKAGATGVEIVTKQPGT